MERIRLIVTALALVAPAAASAQPVLRPCSDKLIATIEADGAVSSGSRELLLERVRNGERIRVGWEIARRGEPPVVVHWQDAAFVTLFEGKLFAQLQGSRQTPQVGTGSIDLPPGTWSSLLTSDSILITRMTDKAEPNRHPVRSHWCAIQ